MNRLTMETARELLQKTTTQPQLLQHALAVSAAMGAMARHFGAEAEHWEAVGFLHDYDYQQYPEEHLRHTEAPQCEAGVDEESIRAILAHGWGVCSDVEPLTEMEKSLYVVDAASALVGAAAKMRPTGISDLQASSVTKKFKDRSFAATVNRETINKGAAMLGMERAEIFTLCIEGMRPHAIRLGITAK